MDPNVMCRFIANTNPANWPPSISMWLMAPKLGGCVLVNLWPFIILPMDIILGLMLLRAVINAIRSLAGQSGNITGEK